MLGEWLPRSGSSGLTRSGPAQERPARLAGLWERTGPVRPPVRPSLASALGCPLHRCREAAGRVRPGHRGAGLPFVVRDRTYWASTQTRREADYLSAFLNSGSPRSRSWTG